MRTFAKQNLQTVLGIMILYNSWLAKCFLGKKKHSFMIFGFCFTRYKYLEIWEEMEDRIHLRQYMECFFLTLLPALGLSLWLSWWFMLIPLCTYHFLYWWERMIRNHSIFDWEAKKHCGDTLYLRKRKSYSWTKAYCKKKLPASRWAD